MKKQYMNIQTGSVDTYDGWWYEDENGDEVNAVDRGEVTEVVKGADGELIDAATITRTRYGVKDRLTGEIVHKTRTAEQQTAHERAEKWCRDNLGNRGEIVELPINTIDLHQAWRCQQTLKITIKGESAFAYPLVIDNCFAVYDYIVPVETLQQWMEQGYTIEISNSGDKS